ncbi:MAG: hypothetical protein GX657_09800 [Chloroflexi bacterium]|nr:hypothetical protein [Chloroflexota bacterium]
MRKLLAILAVIGLTLALALAPVSAGGGQVRGDNGQGGVHQVQTQDPPPFQP